MIVGLIIRAAAGVILFVIVEMRAADPVIPLTLFRDRNFILPSIVGHTRRRMHPEAGVRTNPQERHATWMPTGERG